MPGVLKKLLLVAVGLFALLTITLVYLMRADQRRLRAGTNPCEHACLLDSGGIADCRKQCASHPTTYGPASLPSSH